MITAPAIHLLSFLKQFADVTAECPKANGS